MRDNHRPATLRDLDPFANDLDPVLSRFHLARPRLDADLRLFVLGPRRRHLLAVHEYLGVRWQVLQHKRAVLGGDSHDASQYQGEADDRRRNYGPGADEPVRSQPGAGP